MTRSLSVAEIAIVFVCRFFWSFGKFWELLVILGGFCRSFGFIRRPHRFSWLRIAGKAVIGWFWPVIWAILVHPWWFLAEGRREAVIWGSSSVCGRFRACLLLFRVQWSVLGLFWGPTVSLEGFFGQVSWYLWSFGFLIVLGRS